MVKVNFKGQELPILNGSRITLTNNETLNTAEITTANMGKLAVNLFQDEFSVSVPFDSWTRSYTFLGANISEKRKVVAVGETKYQYTISLISPTVLLKRIVLPNRSITKSLVGTNKTIYDVIKNYRDMYFPSLELHESLSVPLSVECPEIQWNKPTLYEVFLDLFNVVNLIPSVSSASNPVLVALDKTQLGAEISGYNEIEIIQNIENTSDRIEIEAENVYYDVANTKTPVAVVPKTDESAILEIENAVVILDKPIFTVKKVLVSVALAESGELPEEVIRVDITTKVVNKKEYDLAKTSNSTSDRLVGNYKRDRLYFIEGDNKIYGLNYDETSWLGSSQLAIVNILRGLTGDSRISASHILSMGFYVEYTTTDNVGFRVNKTFKEGNNSVLVNNQANSNVDIISLAKREQNLVDSLGGKQAVISGKYYNMSNAPRLNDFYTDIEDNNRKYVISQINYVFQNNFVDVVANGIPHFVLKTGYTGIDMKKRYTQLVDRSQAFLSNHIEEVYLDFSTNAGSNDLLLEQKMIQFGIPSISQTPIAVVYANNKRFALNTSTYPVSNSIVVNFRMRDNVSAGETTSKNFGMLEMNFASYVDSRGELENIQYDLYSNFVVEDVTSFANYENNLAKLRNLPLVDGVTVANNEEFMFYESDTLKRFKDNREITMETIQFFFESNSQVVVGPKFMEKHLFFSNQNITDFTVYYSFDEKYELNDTKAKGIVLSGATVVRTSNYIQVNLTTGSLEYADSWAIADVNGNLFFGVNGNTNRIYLKRRSV